MDHKYNNVVMYHNRRENDWKRQSHSHAYVTSYIYQTAVIKNVIFITKVVNVQCYVYKNNTLSLAHLLLKVVCMEVWVAYNMKITQTC